MGGEKGYQGRYNGAGSRESVSVSPMTSFSGAKEGGGEFGGNMAGAGISSSSNSGNFTRPVFSGGMEGAKGMEAMGRTSSSAKGSSEGGEGMQGFSPGAFTSGGGEGKEGSMPAMMGPRFGEGEGVQGFQGGPYSDGMPAEMGAFMQAAGFQQGMDMKEMAQFLGNRDQGSEGGAGMTADGDEEGGESSGEDEGTGSDVSTKSGAPPALGISGAKPVSAGNPVVS